MTNKQIKRAVEICKEKAVNHMDEHGTLRCSHMKYNKYEIDKFNAIHIYYNNDYNDKYKHISHYMFIYSKGEWEIKTVIYG